MRDRSFTRQLRGLGLSLALLLAAAETAIAGGSLQPGEIVAQARTGGGAHILRITPEEGSLALETILTGPVPAGPIAISEPNKVFVLHPHRTLLGPPEPSFIDPPSFLYEVNVVTGVARLVAQDNSATWTDLAVEPGGDVVIAAGNGLVRWDKASETVSPPFSSGGNFGAWTTGLTIDKNGDIFVPKGGTPGIVRVDPTTGGQTVVLSSAHDIHDIAVDPLTNELITYGADDDDCRFDFIPPRDCPVTRVDIDAGTQDFLFNIDPPHPFSSFGVVSMAVSMAGELLFINPELFSSFEYRFEMVDLEAPDTPTNLDLGGQEIVEFAIVIPACSDGIDNDSDQNTDWPADSNCSDPEDNSERNRCGLGFELALLLIPLFRRALSR